MLCQLVKYQVKLEGLPYKFFSEIFGESHHTIGCSNLHKGPPINMSAKTPKK